MALDTILLTVPADRVATHGLIIGHLTISTSGVSFRSLVPNPKHAIDMAIESIEDVDVTSVASKVPRRLELLVSSHSRFVFLVEDPRACARAVEQSITARKTRTVYR